MMQILCVVAVLSAIVIYFAYSMGKVQGSQEEKDKQDEVIKNALKIKLDANVDELRKKYKRGSSVRSTKSDIL